MASFDFNLSNDSFVLDRDQAAYLNNPAAQSTLKTLYNSHSEEQSPIIQDVYEIINTGGDHIVLYHETAPASILSTAQDDTFRLNRLTSVVKSCTFRESSVVWRKRRKTTSYRKTRSNFSRKISTKNSHSNSFAHFLLKCAV